MHINQLTFTRFIAAFAIILYHFAKKDIYPFEGEYVNFLVRKADTGVSYFFILSGFVMVIAYFNRGSRIQLKDFYINRFARIYPLFFLATFLFLVEWYLIGKEAPFVDVILSFLMIQSWVPSKALILNTPAWSIGVELFFYLLFPVFFNYIYKRINLKNIAIVVITFYLLSQIILQYNIHNLNNFFLYHPIMHFNSFLLGNLAGLLIVKKDWKVKNYDLLLILLFFVLIGSVFLTKDFVVHNGLLAFIILPILFFLSLNNGRITKFFNTPILIFLGEISFGMYILQFPVFIPIRNILSSQSELSDSIIFWISTLFLILVSGIVYYFYEKPLRRKIKLILT